MKYEVELRQDVVVIEVEADSRSAAVASVKRDHADARIESVEEMTGGGRYTFVTGYCEVCCQPIFDDERSSCDDEGMTWHFTCPVVAS